MLVPEYRIITLARNVVHFFQFQIVISTFQEEYMQKTKNESQMDKPIQGLWRWRRTGNPCVGLGRGSLTIFSRGIILSHLKLVTTLCMKTSITSLAYSFPGHIRGPPPKGTNVYGGGPFPSNLDGSNFSGSGKYSGFLSVECDNQCNCEQQDNSSSILLYFVT